jgi:hypothetical protein
MVATSRGRLDMAELALQMGGGLPGISVQWVDCQGVCQAAGPGGVHEAGGPVPGGGGQGGHRGGRGRHLPGQ